MPNISASPNARLLERPLAQLLWHDPLVRFGLPGAIVIVTLIAIQAPAAPPLTLLAAWAAVLGAAISIVAGLARRPTSEQAFWWLWVAALGTGAGARAVAHRLVAGQPPTRVPEAHLAQMLMAVDIARMLFFLLVALALLSAPGTGRRHRGLHPARRSQWMGAVILAFGLAVYFGLLNVRTGSSLAAADARLQLVGTSVALGLAAAHAYLALRQGAERRWRGIHGLLALTLALWPLGGPWWFVALATLAVAARIRHGLPDTSVHRPMSSTLPVAANSLLVPAAVVLPVLHLTACGFDLLNHSFRPIREIVVLLGAAGIGSLAVIEQRRLRESSWAAQRRTMRFAEAAFEGIAEMKDGRIIGANHQLASMFGYAAGELEGRSIAELIGPIDRNRLSKRLRRARKVPVEVQGLRRDRTTFRAEIRTRGFADAVATTQAIAVCDITDRLDLEAKLQQAQKAEIAGRLVGGLARDFNNQLTVILGRSELMMLEDARPSRKDVAEIRQAAEAAASVTRQLLVFAGPQQPAPRVVDLGEVVGAVADSFLERVIPLETEMVVERESECLPVRADRHQLEQLVLGLSLRALDGAPLGSAIHVRAAQRKSTQDNPTRADQELGHESAELEVWVTRPLGFEDGDLEGEETQARSSTSLSTQDSALAALASIAKRNGATLDVDEDTDESRNLVRYRVRFPLLATG